MSAAGEKLEIDVLMGAWGSNRSLSARIQRMVIKDLISRDLDHTAITRWANMVFFDDIGMVAVSHKSFLASQDILAAFQVKQKHFLDQVCTRF